jgi:hypothetical protein
MSARKKIFACLLAVCVVFAGGVAALSVVPHAHGADLDHSQHANCPVHQFSLSHACQASAAPVFVWTVLFVLLWLVSTETGFFSNHRRLTVSSRAPPRTF